MSQNNTPRFNIFLSSTWLDLQTERNAVCALTQRLSGLQFLGMEYFGSRDANVAHASLDEVDRSDIYIGVIGNRYGSGITELEYTRAIESGIPCLIYLKKESVQGTLDAEDTPEAQQRLPIFIERLRKSHTCSEFSAAEDLAVKLSVDLHNWLMEKQLATGLSRVSSDFVTRVQGFVFEYLGGDHRHVPFGGRNSELSRLDSWLVDCDAPPRLLVTAGAGRGKSALLVRWAQSLVTNNQVSSIFFPVSIRFRTNLASVTFTSLAAYLAAMHGESFSYDPNTTIEVWRGRIADFLSRSLPNQQTLVIIIDGLDEAADWEVGPDLFSPYLNLSPNIRIVVSARPLAGDKGPGDWLRRLGWDGFNSADVIELSQLTEKGVANVLVSMGFPLADLAEREEIVHELYRLSEGDPLLIRLYVDDLMSRGVASVKLQVADLRNIKPGLEGFFLRWWDDQRHLWGQTFPLREKHVQTLMNFLACALGPLFRDDILALASASVELNTWTLEEALEPLRRFIVGDGINNGYVYGHPRLGIHFRERLSRSERGAIEDRFLDWCSEQVSWTEASELELQALSSYIVQYFGAHLERAEAPLSRFKPLLSDIWRRAWFAHDGAHSGYKADLTRIQRVIHKSAQKNHSNGLRISAEEIAIGFRCALCLASVNQVAKNTPVELIATLVKKAVWPRHGAIAYVRTIESPKHRVEALINIGIIEVGTSRLQIVQEAFEAMELLDRDSDEAFKVAMLQKMQPLLADSVRADALRVALSLNNRQLMIKAVKAIITSLKPEEVGVLLSSARRLIDLESRLLLMSLAATSYPVQTVAMVTDPSCTLENFEQVSLLISASDGLSNAERSAALSEARRLLNCRAIELGSGDAVRLTQFLDIIERLHDSERAPLLEQALVETDSVSSFRSKVTLLARIAALSGSAEKFRTSRNALNNLVRIKSEFWRAAGLAQLAPQLDESQKILAIQIIDDFADDTAKAQALAQLIPYLNELHQDWVTTILLNISDPFDRLSATVKAIDSLPQSLCDAVATSVLQEIDNWSAVTCAEFSEVTRHLSTSSFEGILTLISTMDDDPSKILLCTAISIHIPILLRRQLNEMINCALLTVEFRPDDNETWTFLGRWAALLTEQELENTLSNILRWRRYNHAMLHATTELAPHLSPDQLRRMLLAFQKIGDKDRCDRFLVVCFERLDPESVFATHLAAWTALDSHNRCEVINSWMANSETLKTDRRADILSIIRTDGIAYHKPAELIANYFQYFNGVISKEEISGLIEMKFDGEAQKQNVLATLVSALSTEQLAPHLPELFRASLHYGKEAVSLATRIARMTTPAFVYKMFVQVCNEQFTHEIDETEYPRFPLLLALMGVVEADSREFFQLAADYLWETVGGMSEENRAWFIDDVGRRFDGVGESLFQRLVAFITEFTDRQRQIKAALRLLPRLREPIVSNFVPKVVAWLMDTDKNLVKVNDYFNDPLARIAAEASAWQAAALIHCLPRLGQDYATQLARPVYRELQHLQKSGYEAQLLMTLFPIASEDLRLELVRDLEAPAYTGLRQLTDLQPKLEILIMLLPYFSQRAIRRVLLDTLAWIKAERDFKKNLFHSNLEKSLTMYQEHSLKYMDRPLRIVAVHFLKKLGQRLPARIGRILMRTVPTDFLLEEIKFSAQSPDKLHESKFAIDDIFQAANISRYEVLDLAQSSLSDIYKIGDQFVVNNIAASLEEIRHWWP